jgi:hypothetical protein
MGADTARSDGADGGRWRGRVDQRALVLDPPAWLVAELGPMPSDPGDRAVWRVAAAELDGCWRAYGLDHPGPAKHGWGRVAREGRSAAPSTTLTAARDGTAGHRDRGERDRGERARQPLRTRRVPAAAEDRHRVDAGRLLGAEPRRGEPDRRRDWQTVRAALERLADPYRGRDVCHRSLDRAGQPRTRDLGRQERDGG